MKKLRFIDPAKYITRPKPKADKSFGADSSYCRKLTYVNATRGTVACKACGLYHPINAADSAGLH